MAGRWTEAETVKLVLLYNRMMQLHRAGELGQGKARISKAQLVRDYIVNHAPTRSRPSVEFKLRNISAVRQAKGLAVLPGYLPAANVSSDLAELIGGAE